MINGENKRKHLDIIQAVIARMAKNSFLLKGWTITILSAVFIFFDKAKESSGMEYSLLVPIIAFWLLDGFFIAQERGYISKYNEVRLMNEDQIDFDLSPMGGKIRLFLKALFSPTIVCYYGFLSLTVILILYQIA